LLLAALVFTPVLRAQDPPAAEAPLTVPEPEDVTLQTADGVQLHCVWMAGRADKETVPVIMLHNWDASEDDRKQQMDMANYLHQTHGFAILVPDIRGHGRSMTLVDSTTELDRSRWRRQEILGAVQDIEACKKFLIQKNNAGELNIDLLAVIAEAELGIHAAMWAIRDWSYPPLAGRKQGQDVKALVLIDPVKAFKGINGNEYFRAPLFTGDPGAGFPILVASRSSRDAESLYEMWERFRRSLDESVRHLEATSFRIERQERVVKSPDAEDQLLSAVVGDFLTRKIVDRRHEFRWQDRSSD
jgi:pimeloyl-ACP methyl ester carboxylesterase